MQVGNEGLHCLLLELPLLDDEEHLVGRRVGSICLSTRSSNVIEAATSIFAGHDVRSIANCLVPPITLGRLHHALATLIQRAREEGKRFLISFTGVPGIR